MPPIHVTRTHLELRSPSELRPARLPSDPVELRLERPIDAATYRALYTRVGERWLWRDRLLWSDGELTSYLASPAVHVWTARVRDDVAGYVELQQRGQGTAEIMYFGLVPEYIGRGIGGWLLTRAAELAFQLDARRVILNTCTLDGPHALPNYLARGFSIVREDHYLLDLSARSRPDATEASAQSRG